jgi:hypothetical protein
MSDLVLSNLTINGRPVGLFEFQPDPPFPSMTYLRSGFVQPSPTRPTNLFWYIPRTNRIINGERPWFCYGRWGGSGYTCIVGVKQCSISNNTITYSGKVKYKANSNQPRTGFGNTSSSDYLNIRQSMVNFTDTLGYTVLYGGVQSFSSNPFNGDWTKGDEGHLFSMTVESDDIGFIVGTTQYSQYSAIRTCECEQHAYYYVGTLSELNSAIIGDTVNGSFTGTDCGGNMLHSSQSNFGWWWEVN